MPDMWVKEPDDAVRYHNVDQVDIITAPDGAAAGQVRFGVSTVRTFGTQAEAIEWIEDLLTSIKED